MSDFRLIAENCVLNGTCSIDLHFQIIDKEICFLILEAGLNLFIGYCFHIPLP